MAFQASEISLQAAIPSEPLGRHYGVQLTLISGPGEQKKVWWMRSGSASMWTKL